MPSCTLCQSTHLTVIRKKLRYDIERDVLRCEQCDYVFLRPLEEKEKDFYEEKTYRNTYGPDLTKKSNSQEIFDTYFPYQKQIISCIEPLLRPDMRVLDVGCSTGHFLAALKGKVNVRVGLELSQDAVDFIRAHLDFPVYGDPIEEAAIAEGPFDLITSLQVVEHVKDPVAFLRAIGTHLKPGGYLYLEVPNLHDILLDHYHIPGYADFYFREPHISYFTKNTFQDAIDKAGFVGTMGNVQRYNFLNHLHWKITGGPQPNFGLGNSDPILIDHEKDISPVAQDFNTFFRRADEEYRALIEKHWLGESLTFLGQKKA